MAYRIIHRLLQSRRALPLISRSSSPPETSIVSTSLSNAFSSSSADPTTLWSSSPAKHPPAASTVPPVFRKQFSSSTTGRKFPRQVRSKGTNTRKGVKRGDKWYKNQIAEIRKLSALCDEHDKLFSAYDEDCQTEEDALEEKSVDRRMERLKKVNESISEINVVAKRIVASSPPQKEKMEGEWIYWAWFILFLLSLIQRRN